MIVEELPVPDLAEALATSGLTLNTGAFRTRLRSDVPELAWHLSTLYADFPVETEETISDFLVRIVRTPGIRRYYRPQVRAYIERERPFVPMPQELAFPMFESSLNWCIATRVSRHLLVHAAAVARDGRAVVLAAPSGSGKSTLSAFMALEGWQLLSDEFAIIRLADGRLLPNPRPVSLKNEAISRVRAHGDGAWVSREFEGTAKGTVAFLRPPTPTVLASDSACAPALVVFPAFEANAALTLARVSRADAFMEILDNAVNYLIHRRRGFEVVARLVEQCECYRLTFGDTAEAIATLNELLDSATRGSEASPS